MEKKQKPGGNNSRRSGRKGHAASPGRKNQRAPFRAGARAQTQEKTGRPGRIRPASGAPERLHWRSGNMLYPVPAVMVTCADPSGRANIITIAWTGTVCSDPAMVYISVRPERYSYGLIRESGEFVINLTTEALAGAADFCGVRSGRELDKFRECGLTPLPSEHVAAPSIAESPVSIECRVKQVLPLGTHDLFLAEVLGVSVDSRYLDASGKFCLEQARPVAYSHGAYYSMGALIGSFGFSVRRKKKQHTQKK